MKSTITHKCQPRDQIKDTARARVERKRWNSRCRADVIWEIIIVVCSRVLVGLSGLVGSVGGGGGGREGGEGGEEVRQAGESCLLLDNVPVVHSKGEMSL